MIIIKTPEQIHGIRLSGQLAAATLLHVKKYIAPGISTQALNDIAHKYIIEHGAIPAPLNYNGFPKSICTSVNDVVTHGIPSSKQILKNGDVINIDITTILNGYYGDVSASYPVGKISKDVQIFVDHVKKSLFKSIETLKPGKYMNDCVGKIIEPYLKKYGYSVVRDLGGHGVGIKFHEDPFVYHYDTGRHGIILKPGMTFAIEPMINMSPDHRVFMERDGWTIRTRDGSPSAQFEHTILITKNGYEILTACDY